MAEAPPLGGTAVLNEVVKGMYAVITKGMRTFGGKIKRRCRGRVTTNDHDVPNLNKRRAAILAQAADPFAFSLSQSPS
jgi:hypothetical protein